MKTVLLFLIVISSGCGSIVRTTTLSPDNNNMVQIPINKSVKSGYIITNEMQIDKYQFQKNNPTDTLKYHPVKNYGDFFVVREYNDIDELSFYEGIVALRIQEKMDIITVKETSKGLLVNSETTSYQLDWQNYSDNDLKDLLKKAVDKVIIENDLGDDYKRKLIARYSTESGISTADIKAKTNYAYRGIHAYPPIPLMEWKDSKRVAYSMRKDFSNATVQTGFVYIPGQKAFTNASYMALYPSGSWSVKEKFALFMDSISINLGVALAAANEASNDSFNQSKERLLAGVGFDIGSNFSAHLGYVIWDNKDKLEKSGYAGVSLDLLNLASTLSK